MIYNPYFEDRGIDAVVVPMGCEAEDYAAFLPLVFRLRNIAGALVTMPHKVTTVGLLDEASPAVKICGACNAVKRDSSGRLIGDMFDGEGFVRSALRKGHTIAGASAIVVGSGGAGSAIAASLANAGAGRLALFDTREALARRLAENIARQCPGIEISVGSNDPAGFGIVVNATPCGMEADDLMPMDVDRISPDALVGDVVMKSEETPFLAAAQAKGCTIQVGTDMLFEQIPAYLEFFGFPTTTADDLRRHARLQY